MYSKNSHHLAVIYLALFVQLLLFGITFLRQTSDMHKAPSAVIVYRFAHPSASSLVIACQGDDKLTWIVFFVGIRWKFEGSLMEYEKSGKHVSAFKNRSSDLRLTLWERVHFSKQVSETINRKKIEMDSWTRHEPCSNNWHGFLPKTELGESKEKEIDRGRRMSIFVGMELGTVRYWQTEQLALSTKILFFVLSFLPWLLVVREGEGFVSEHLRQETS